MTSRFRALWRQICAGFDSLTLNPRRRAVAEPGSDDPGRPR